MNTTFEDNTAVTLEDLNNVAVDLGHADFSAFDTEKFGVDKLNQITSDLVSSGVLRTGENGALGCEVIVSGDKAYVQAGVIVFTSGAKIRITNPVGIDLIPGTYIYALNDSATGKVSLVATETEPDGDYVLLAEVNSYGVIADKRSSCVAKVSMTADIQNVYREVTVSVSQNGGSEVEFEVDMGSSAFSCIYVISAERKWIDSVQRYIPKLANAALLTDNMEEYAFYMGKDQNDYTQASYYVRKVGQRLLVRLVATGTPSAKHTLNFILM